MQNCIIHRSDRHHRVDTTAQLPSLLVMYNISKHFPTSTWLVCFLWGLSAGRLPQPQQVFAILCLNFSGFYLSHTYWHSYNKDNIRWEWDFVIMLNSYHIMKWWFNYGIFSYYNWIFCLSRFCLIIIVNVFLDRAFDMFLLFALFESFI